MPCRCQRRPGGGGAAAADERSQSTYSAFVAASQDQIPVQLHGVTRIVGPRPVVIAAPDGSCWEFKRDAAGCWRIVAGYESMLLDFLEPMGRS